MSMTRFRHILLPTDFGEGSKRALDAGASLAQKLGASLTLLHTFEIPPYAYSGIHFSTADLLTTLEEAARLELETALVSLRERVPRAASLFRRGIPWQDIQASIAETGADLVVMGTHGRRGIAHALLGSVAEKTVRMSSVPVLTLRALTP